MSIRHFKECFDCGHVGALGSFCDGASVLVVVIVVVVRADVEETIALEVDVLMYLEIKTNGFHDMWNINGLVDCKHRRFSFRLFPK